MLSLNLKPALSGLIAVAVVALGSCRDPVTGETTFEGVVFDVSGTCHAFSAKGKVYAVNPGQIDKHFKRWVVVTGKESKIQDCPGATKLDVTKVEVVQPQPR
jgi:ribosomal protein L31